MDPTRVLTGGDEQRAGGVGADPNPVDQLWGRRSDEWCEELVEHVDLGIEFATHAAARVFSVTRFAFGDIGSSPGTEPGSGSHQPRNRQAPKLGAELVGCGRDQRSHLVQRPGAIPFGTVASKAQHTDRFDVAVARLRFAERVTRERGPCRAAPRRECRTCPTGVGAADSADRPRPPRSPTLGDDELIRRRSCRSLPLRLAPPLPTTRTTRRARDNRRCRRERCGSQQAAVFIERGSDVHIEVGVDATSDLCSHDSVSSPASTGWEDTRPAGTADKTTTSLFDRLLVSHSARPVGVGVGTQNRSTDQSQDSPATPDVSPCIRVRPAPSTHHRHTRCPLWSIYAWRTPWLFSGRHRR